MYKKFKALLVAHKENERYRKRLKELRQRVAGLLEQNKDLRSHHHVLGKANNKFQKETSSLSIDKTNLTAENRNLKKELDKPPTVKGLLQLVFEGKLEWYNYEDLSPSLLQQYYDQAQYMLRMDIFNNEMNFLKSNWSRQAVIEAHEVEDPDEHLLKLSWMLLGIKLFKTRLEGVPNPTQPTPTQDDTHANI